MNRLGIDPKVKKTLVRNCEQKVRPSSRIQVAREMKSHSSNFVPDLPSNSSPENDLGQPTLCSSDALANYLSDVKKSLPPPLSCEDLNVDRGQLCTKMTKKLNFHFNDRIYKNLIELNATIEDLKRKTDKRPSSSTNSLKKDLEPDIEDFCQDEEELDSPPPIPVIKPKFKPVRRVEDRHLHKLVAAFEVL